MDDRESTVGGTDTKFPENYEPFKTKIPYGPTIVGQENDSDIHRSIKPHIAIVTLKIDIRSVNSDETLDLHVMGNDALQKYGLARKGQFVIKGTSEADCIKKLKDILENITNG